ncbi:MAG: hypothetical protein HOL66_07370 [Rhodospirillaceae bacterium]|jgi:hypothetical protein|nr:hypothetical protein [Rhodospirillaceae bacterium]MBT5244048.1 hypothetical protein [Rhodospirillaceae bacterium]MBT5560868.1 hypothetical protein [Rhodospirillaceae bacterium]MBT6241157.1 hypothetical protein [Rhodospirillaceae bacterium]MBT7138325.1 hypothetical protein [Rhodospirillaceae bacterium]
MKRALVIFTDRTDLRKLWLLKRGYRHCFAIIEGRSGWAVFNPLSHYTEIETYPSLDEEEIAQFYQGLGFTVLRTQIGEVPKKLAPLFPYTCVEAVKRTLGIQVRAVVTPWQLYQFIENNHKIEKKSLTYPFD